MIFAPSSGSPAIRHRAPCVTYVRQQEGASGPEWRACVVHRRQGCVLWEENKERRDRSGKNYKERVRCAGAACLRAASSVVACWFHE